jgi:hypothetical protein
MRHQSLISIFEVFAEQHKEIQHGAGGRKSFFRINKEAEIINDSSVRVDYPVLLVQNASGKYKSTGDVSDDTTCVFEIRTTVQGSGNFDEIETARDKCKFIGENIIALIDSICEDEGYCGPIDSIDIDQVFWEFTGPVNTNEYGCQFRFTFQKTAYDPYSWDPEQYFNLEHFENLIDFNDAPLIDYNGDALKDII